MADLREITYALHKLVFVMDKIGDQLLQEKLSLTFSQFRILMALRFKPDNCQREIADYWDMTEAAVSRQVDILQDKKLISKKANEVNRREHILTLTPTGKHQVEVALKILDLRFGEIYKSLTTTECDSLLKSIRKLLGAVFS